MMQRMWCPFPVMQKSKHSSFTLQEDRSIIVLSSVPIMHDDLENEPMKSELEHRASNARDATIQKENRTTGDSLEKATDGVERDILNITDDREGKEEQRQAVQDCKNAFQSIYGSIMVLAGRVNQRHLRSYQRTENENKEIENIHARVEAIAEIATRHRLPVDVAMLREHAAKFSTPSGFSNVVKTVMPFAHDIHRSWYQQDYTAFSQFVSEQLNVLKRQGEPQQLQTT